MTKRLSKFRCPVMVAGRVEAEIYDRFWDILCQQPTLTLQDYMNYSFKLFLERKIVIDASGKEFALASELDEIPPQPDELTDSELERIREL